MVETGLDESNKIVVSFQQTTNMDSGFLSVFTTWHVGPTDPKAVARFYCLFKQMSL